MNSLNVKKGDNVLVIAGKDKGKKGKIITTLPTKGKVVVEGVSIISKHQKARTAQDKSGIIKKESPIDASNIQVICTACQKVTRVAHTFVEGKKIRVCKKCGESLDAGAKKAVKKAATVKKSTSAKKSTDKE